MFTVGRWKTGRLEVRGAALGGCLLGLVLAALVLLHPASAGAATEIVLVLDNSCSMVENSQFDDRSVPPADPDRLSVLATLILAQLRDTEDAFHILNFNGKGAPPTFRSLGTDKQSIRDMQYDAQTLFRGVLTEATRILNSSGHERRLLVFVTDGMPSDRVPTSESFDQLEDIAQSVGRIFEMKMSSLIK